MIRGTLSTGLYRDDVEERIKRILGPLKPTVSPEFDESPLEYAGGVTVKNIADTMARSRTHRSPYGRDETDSWGCRVVRKEQDAGQGDFFTPV